MCILNVLELLDISKCGVEILNLSQYPMKGLTLRMSGDGAFSRFNLFHVFHRFATITSQKFQYYLMILSVLRITSSSQHLSLRPHAR